MREIAEIELAIQGGTEKIEALGMSLSLLRGYASVLSFVQASRVKWKSP
jgi:hypothetical protein